jgi:hypothetical protein
MPVSVKLQPYSQTLELSDKTRQRKNTLAYFSEASWTKKNIYEFDII